MPAARRTAGIEFRVDRVAIGAANHYLGRARHDGRLDDHGYGRGYPGSTVSRGHACPISFDLGQDRIADSRR